MPINWVPIQAGNQFQGQMGGGGGGGGHVTGPLQDQGSAIEWARIQQRNAEMSQHGAVTARDAWMAQQQEEGEQRRAERDVEIYGARLSMQEEMEMNRRRNALSVIDNHPGLASEDRNNLRTQILTGLNPLEARAQRMRVTQQQMQLQQATQHNDFIAGLRMRNGQAGAGSANSQLISMYHPQALGLIQTELMNSDPSFQELSPELRSVRVQEVASERGLVNHYYPDQHGTLQEVRFPGAGRGRGSQGEGQSISPARDFTNVRQLIQDFDRQWDANKPTGFNQMTPEAQGQARDRAEDAFVSRRLGRIERHMGVVNQNTQPQQPVRSPNQLPAEGRQLYGNFDAARQLAQQNAQAFPHDSRRIATLVDTLQRMTLQAGGVPRRGPAAEEYRVLSEQLGQLTDAISGRTEEERRRPQPAAPQAGVMQRITAPLAGPGTVVGRMLGR